MIEIVKMGNGQAYVCKYAPDLLSEEDEWVYLYPDLAWRERCWYSHSMDGYFPTLAAAQEALVERLRIYRDEGEVVIKEES